MSQKRMPNAPRLPKLPGLPDIVLAGRELLTQLTKALPPPNISYKRVKKSNTFKAPDMKNPLEFLMKGVSRSLAKLTARPAEEDYNAIVMKHIPAGGKLLTPQYPRNSKAIQFADLDGDSRNELIATYSHNNQVKTVVLKKQNEMWYKLGEVSNPDYGTLNYRGVADITGNGKKHLILGLTSKGKTPSLYGYSIAGNTVNQAFTRNYHRFEVLDQFANAKKTHLAVWDIKDDNTYNVEVLGWDGAKLGPVKNASSYYYRSVVPYIADKVKRAPYAAAHWYTLADSLVKAGMQRDALMSVDIGMSLNSSPEYKEKFTALKNQITGNK